MSPLRLLLTLLLPAVLAAPSTFTVPHLTSPLALLSAPTAARFNLPQALTRRAPTSRAGLTLDPCSSSAPCDGDRTCLTSAATPCPAGDTQCVCLPPDLIVCLSASECPAGQVCGCPDGEVCADTPFSLASLCVSATVEAVLSSVVAVTAPRPLNTPALTLDRCTDDDQCADTRECSYLLADEPCQGRAPCVCAPPFFQLCFDLLDCADGETCSEIPNLAIPVCASTDAWSRLPSIQLVFVPPDTQGYSLDPCATDLDCQGTRLCFEFNAGDDSDGPCTGVGACACLLPEATFLKCGSGAAPCESGEVCALVGYTEDLNQPVCISEDIANAFRSTVTKVPEDGETAPASPVPEQSPVAQSPLPVAPPSEEGSAPASPASSPSDPDGPLFPPAPDDDPSATATPASSASPDVDFIDVGPEATEDPICVDARALGHLAPSELVYATHSVATTLCDGNGSCATGGHVVVWQGRAMMMSTYCAEVACSRRVMQVNSPRFGRGRRVKSRTEGLEYTALAARYGTRVEEMVIATAVRIGL